MSIRRMTLWAGFRYLMASVARSDTEGPTSSPLTACYTQAGTPQGRFLGRGLRGLDNGRGVQSGSVVTEEHLWRMLGMLQDPLTGDALGMPPGRDRPSTIDVAGRTRPASRTVAGFDLTFNAPKSVSVAWALADPATRERIRAAHTKALQFVIAHAEARVFATRTGHAGAISQDVRGMVAAGFEHWDSRAGDPQLHTHVVVLNRVQAVSDGRWRTLDSRVLFKATVGLSELYNAALSDYLTADLGFGWVPLTRRRSAVPKWEIDGVPEPVQREFSQRASAIETVKDDLVEEFVAARGRQPTTREVLQMRQRATLDTRPDKHLVPLAELVARWRSRAAEHMPRDTAGWAAGLAGRNRDVVHRVENITAARTAEVACLALGEVAGSTSPTGAASSSVPEGIPPRPRVEAIRQRC